MTGMIFAVSIDRRKDMKHLMFICSILIFTTFLQAQDLEITSDGADLRINHGNKLKLEYLSLDEFQALELQPGFAHYPDGNARAFDGMKYNLIEGWIDVNVKGHVLTLLPGSVSGVSMNSGEMVDHIFVKVIIDQPVFMEILSVGSLDLMLYRFELEKNDEDDKMTSEVTIRFDKAVEVIDFSEKMYVWGKDGARELKTNKKFILRLMEDRSSEIERYFKGNKMQLKNPKDLIALFNYYNSL